MHKWSKIIIYLTQLTTRSTGVVSSWSFGWSAVNLACVTSMCSVQCFPGGHSLHLAFGSYFYPHPFPLYSSTDKSVWQVSGSIGVGAHGWRASFLQVINNQPLKMVQKYQHTPRHLVHFRSWRTNAIDSFCTMSINWISMKSMSYSLPHSKFAHLQQALYKQETLLCKVWFIPITTRQINWRSFNSQLQSTVS